MNTAETTEGAAIDAALLDRLVDGEMDDAARAAVLRRLDIEPNGWKRCALAFLEAQSWRQLLAAGADAGAGTPGRAGGDSPPRRTAFRQVFAVAAAVLVAFGVGFVSRGPAASRRNGDVGGDHVVAHGQQGASSRGGEVIPAAPRVEPAPAVSEYLRQQMERQGYRVDGGRKLVPVALKDGRKVTVPVDTVSMRFVGQRIH